RGAFVPFLHQPLVQGHSVAFAWKGQLPSLVSALLHLLDRPDAVQSLLWSFLDTSLPSEVRAFCDRVSDGSASSATLRAEGTALLGQLRREQTAQQADQYGEWLEEASSSHLGPLFRAIKSHEQVLDRPFQDCDGLRRVFERHEHWARVWQASVFPQHFAHPLLAELRLRAVSHSGTLAPLTVPHLQKLLKKAGKKKGGPDGWSYPALRALDPAALQLVADFLARAEAEVLLPFQLTCVQVALLPKSADKERPISLLPCLWRLWARARWQDISAWTSAYAPAHPWDRAVPGQASLDPALARLVRSEHSKLERTHIVSLFLDLRGFFDSVSYERLLLQGLAHSFPPLHLWFALQVYQGPRCLVADSIAATPLFPGRGVPQGCPLAPSLSKLTMSEPLQKVSSLPFVTNTDLWLDDVSLDVVGSDPVEVASSALQAYRVLHTSLGLEGLEVETTKTKFVAGTARARAALQQLRRPGEPDTADLVKDLGLDCAAGRRRRITTAQKRFRTGIGRVRHMRRLRIRRRWVRGRLLQASALKAGLYGHQAVGVAPKRLKVLRSAVARKAGRFEHGSADVILDLMSHKAVDPHQLVVVEQLQASSASPEGVRLLTRTWASSWSRQASATHGWKIVNGPVSALIQYLLDLRVSAPTPEVWTHREATFHFRFRDPGAVFEASAFLRRVIQLERWSRIGTVSTAAGAALGIDWTVPRRLLASPRTKPWRHGLRAVFQGALLHSGNGGKERCKFCGGPNTLHHLLYECENIPGALMPAGWLSYKRRHPADCLWLRGMRPLSPREPLAREAEVRRTGLFLEGTPDLTGLCVATDASGGPASKDSRLRSVGWAAVVASRSDGDLVVLGTLSGLLPAPASVPEGESEAIAQVLLSSRGTFDLTCDCQPALRSLQGPFTKRTSLVWAKAWEHRHRAEPHWVRSHLSPSDFCFEFGADALWRHELNSLADKLARDRAEEVQTPHRLAAQKEVDRVTSLVCEYLGHRAVAILAKAEKEDFVPRKNRLLSALEPSSSPSPNKRQRLQALLDEPPLPGGHVWSRTSKEKSFNMCVKCSECSLCIYQVDTPETFERLISFPCRTAAVSCPFPVHPSHSLVRQGPSWKCGQCHGQVTLRMGEHDRERVQANPPPAPPPAPRRRAEVEDDEDQPLPWSRRVTNRTTTSELLAGEPTVRPYSRAAAGKARQSRRFSEEKLQRGERVEREAMPIALPPPPCFDLEIEHIRIFATGRSPQTPPPLQPQPLGARGRQSLTTYWLLVDEHEIAAHDSPHLAVPPSPLVAEVPQREVAPELPPATSSPPAEVSLPRAASLATRGSSPLPEPTGPPMSFHPRNRGPPAQVEHSVTAGVASSAPAGPRPSPVAEACPPTGPKSLSSPSAEVASPSPAPPRQPDVELRAQAFPNRAPLLPSPLATPEVKPSPLAEVATSGSVGPEPKATARPPSGPPGTLSKKGEPAPHTPSGPGKGATISTAASAAATPDVASTAGSGPLETLASLAEVSGLSTAPPDPAEPELAGLAAVAEQRGASPRGSQVTKRRTLQARLLAGRLEVRLQLRLVFSENFLRCFACGVHNFQSTTMEAHAMTSRHVRLHGLCGQAKARAGSCPGCPAFRAVGPEPWHSSPQAHLRLLPRLLAEVRPSAVLGGPRASLGPFLACSAERAKEKKKQIYLMKAINNGMKKKPRSRRARGSEEPGRSMSRTTVLRSRLEIPFVEVTISGIVKEPRGPPAPSTVPQPKTLPARAARAPEVKAEGACAAKVPEVMVEGMEINFPPPGPEVSRTRALCALRVVTCVQSAAMVTSVQRASGCKGQGNSSQDESLEASSREESREAARRGRRQDLQLAERGGRAREHRDRVSHGGAQGSSKDVRQSSEDVHHPGISDSSSSLGLSLLMQEKLAFACEHDVAVELGEHACVGGLGEHDLQHGELLEHVGQNRPQRPAAKEAMLNDMSAWSRSVGLVGVAPSELTVSVKSDIEGVVKNLAQSFADGLTAGAIEVVDAPVGWHAVVAERAVRTIKEGANTLCAGLEQVGLEPCGKGVTYLLMHVAQVYNRYQVHPGSALSPEQRCLKTTRGPHAAYVWGAAVLATPPPSLRDKITGRYGHAAYLGPEVGSGSHIVQFRLRDGALKIARSARIRMLVPLTFEVSSLKGVCRMLPGRRDDAQKKLPESSGDNVRDLPLPNTATRGPPPEWIEENGRTPRCRACRLRGFPADKAWHTQKCRDRYAEFVRNSFDPSRAILDQAPIEEEDLAEYEPSLPGVENEIELGEELEQIEAPSPGELDFMQVDPEPLEALPEEEREAMVSSVMYRESISFAGASVCFAGAATKADSNWVNVLTVSERDDGASAQTLLELKAIFAAQIKKKVLRAPEAAHIKGCVPVIQLIAEGGRDHLLIAKRWRVVTTHPAVAESIRVYRCSGKHEHSKDFDLKSTQHYPTTR
ncbi:unnamed protein product, partial [Symbiodinium sp. CCMP2592]